jgi:two-component SAPR family response regulator
MGAKPVRARHVRWAAVGNGFVLYNSLTDAYFQLNDVGASIWELLDGSLEAEQVAEEISKEYSVDLATAESDVAEYISELLKVSLLEV